MGLISKQRMNHVFRKGITIFPCMGQYQGKSPTISKIYEKTRFFRNFLNSHPFLNLNLLLVDPATYVMSGKNERTPKNFYQRFLKKMRRRKSRFTTNLCRYIQTN
jgi:hypothetical protein